MLEQKTVEDMIKSNFKQDVSILSKYTGNKNLIKIKCNECNSEWECPARSVMYNDFEHKCPFCNTLKHRIVKRHRYLNHWKHQRIRCIYNMILSRCYDENSNGYEYYGKKGIKVCEEWLKDEKQFERWALDNGYEETLTIDRINEIEDYSPNNCRWITLEENAKWKSTTNKIEVNGIVDSGRGWSQRLQLGVNHINKYMRKHGIEKTIEYIKKIL